MAPGRDDVRSMVAALFTLTARLDRARRHRPGAAALSLLQVIAGRDGVRPSELTDRQAVHPSLVTRPVRELEAKGYTQVTADPGDGRSWPVTLTRAGRPAGTYPAYAGGPRPGPPGENRAADLTGEQAIPGDAPSGGRRDRQLLAWGVIGVLAQAAFLVGWLIAETWQGPRYSPVADTISDLQAATAPHYWFPVACFAAGGLGTFGFAVLGLRPALAGAGRTAARAPWMLACAALALGNSFPLIPCRLADPGCTAHRQLYSPGGLTDAVVSGIAFLVLALTPFPLWRRLAVLPEWRRVRPAMMTARIVCPVSYLFLGISSSVGSAQGLAERILATACVLWMGTLAINLILVSRDHPSATRTGSVMPADQLAPQHRPRRGLATAWRSSRWSP